MSEILCDTPYLFSLCTPIPFNESLGTFDIFSYRFLAQDVLPCSKSLPDEVRLHEEGNGDDDGMDVFAIEEVFKRGQWYGRIVIVPINILFLADLLSG